MKSAEAIVSNDSLKVSQSAQLKKPKENKENRNWRAARRYYINNNKNKTSADCQIDNQFESLSEM